MSTTYELRRRWCDLARLDVGRKEVTRNTAPWIAKLWPATNYPDGMAELEPYCAAGMAYTKQQWLTLPEVLDALGKTPEEAEKWRCKSAVAFDWIKWAKRNGALVLPPHCVLHAADLAVYVHSHIELVTNDDGTTNGPFTAIGYNTNASGSRDGEGCFEKPRSREKVKCFLRLLA